MGEVIGHGEVLQAPSTCKAVTDKIHAPHLVDRAGQRQRHPLADRPFAFLALAHSQIGPSVKTVHPLVIDTRKLWAQQVVNAPVPCPSSLPIDSPPSNLLRALLPRRELMLCALPVVRSSISPSVSQTFRRLRKSSLVPSKQWATGRLVTPHLLVHLR